MFKIRLKEGEEESRVYFKHIRLKQPLSLPIGRVDPDTGVKIRRRVRGFTTCTLIYPETEEARESVAEGTSYCMATDVFTKEEGRKQALEKMLNYLRLPTGQHGNGLRGRIWGAYFTKMYRDRSREALGQAAKRIAKLRETLNKTKERSYGKKE